MFLKIENLGVCPVEGFVVYGLSTSRGKEEKIGQFGTGNKHGINTLLRHKINFHVFCGTKRLEFITKDKEMNGTPYQLVCYKKGNKIVETSSALSHGELDWDNIDMAIREFISNAIDMCEDVKDVTIELVSDDAVKGKANHTCIFIDATPEVIKYYGELHNNFLHFDERVNESLIDNNDEDQSRIYRKGVFVRSIDKKPGLFDYNFGDELKVDECRNLDDYRVKNVTAKMVVSNEKGIRKIFEHIGQDEKYWEFTFGQYDTYVYSTKDKEMFKRVWEEIHGNAVITTDDIFGIELGRRAATKNYKVIYTSSPGWFNACISAGIPNAKTIGDAINENGYEYCEVTRTDTIKVAQEIWTWFEALGLTFDKKFPTIKNFKKIMENNIMLLGFYDKKTDVIGINVDHASSKLAMLEEMIHYVSGANDESREFQDFTKKMIIAACE